MEAMNIIPTLSTGHGVTPPPEEDTRRKITGSGGCLAGPQSKRESPDPDDER